MAVVNAGDAISGRLAGIASGHVAVEAVNVEDRDDSAGAYTLVVVSLTPPPSGQIWDADEFYEVRRAARREVTEALGADAAVQITFTFLGPDEAAGVTVS